MTVEGEGLELGCVLASSPGVSTLIAAIWSPFCWNCGMAVASLWSCRLQNGHQPPR
jgi:hypothetical protein